MNIRKATAGDTERLVVMGRRFLRESQYASHLQDNPEQIAAVIGHVLGSPSGRVLVAMNGGEQPVGMLAWMTNPHPYSLEMTAIELVWWVEPEARKSRAGMMLIAEAEKEARAQGAKRMQMIAPAGAQKKNVAKLYEHRGYREVETTWQKEL